MDVIGPFGNSEESGCSATFFQDSSKTKDLTKVYALSITV